MYPSLYKVMVCSWCDFSSLEQQIQFFQEAAWKFNSCPNIDNPTFLRSSGLCFPGVSQTACNKKARCSKVLTALNITTEGKQTLGCGKKFPTSLSDKLLFSLHSKLLFLWQWPCRRAAAVYFPAALWRIKLKLWIAPDTSDKSILARDGFVRFRRWYYQLEEGTDMSPKDS